MRISKIEYRKEGELTQRTLRKRTEYTEKQKNRELNAETQRTQRRAQAGVSVPRHVIYLQGCNLTGADGCARLFVVSPCSGFDAAGNLQEESHRPPVTFGRSTFQVDEAHHTHYRKN